MSLFLRPLFSLCHSLHNFTSEIVPAARRSVFSLPPLLLSPLIFLFTHMLPGALTLAVFHCVLWHRSCASVFQFLFSPYPVDLTSQQTKQIALMLSANRESFGVTSLDHSQRDVTLHFSNPATVANLWYCPLFITKGHSTWTWLCQSFGTNVSVSDCSTSKSFNNYRGVLSSDKIWKSSDFTCFVTLKRGRF